MNNPPALALHDILACVLAFVEKSQLPSSARVCKAWNELALNELWKDLPSLFPLLDLLGTLVYENGAWTFQEGLDDPAWDRWIFYATRIRCLTIDDTQVRGSRNSVIHPELSIHLRSSYSKWEGIHLTPKIQKLSLSYSDPATASLALLFSDPSLKALHLSLESSAGNLFSATRKVLMTLTAMRDTLKLQEIGLHCWRDAGHAVEFDSTLINFIGSQPSISALNLALVINVEMLESILKAVSLLKILFLGLLGHPGDDRLDTTSALISKHHRNLEHLKYYSGLPYHSTVDLHRAAVPRCYPVTSECMGRAWRDIKRLDLLPVQPSEYKDGVSIAVLQQIATTFAPSLRYIAIPIAFGPEPAMTPLTSGTKFPALHVLEVGYSIIPKDNIRRFVEFLSTITPLGITVKHSHRTDGEQGKNWGDVNDQLQMVQRIKKQTRSELVTEQT
ncbi:hypothetical protein FRC04_001675 [Tulasnella sp. 424]|nr:hypothetical protein FRC04_001675 [Tulasnella sp. 424]KAG8971120.1 hypothetical protein FRC05_011489 [Tulasnella sp. 425]